MSKQINVSCLINTRKELLSCVEQRSKRGLMALFEQYEKSASSTRPCVVFSIQHYVREDIDMSLEDITRIMKEAM